MRTCWPPFLLLCKYFLKGQLMGSGTLPLPWDPTLPFPLVIYQSLLGDQPFLCTRHSVNCFTCCFRCFPKLGGVHIKTGLPRWLSGKESACQCRRHGFHPWVGKIPWGRKQQSNPVVSSGKFHEQRSLASCCPWVAKNWTRLSNRACMHAFYNEQGGRAIRAPGNLETSRREFLLLLCTQLIWILQNNQMLPHWFCLFACVVSTLSSWDGFPLPPHMSGAGLNTSPPTHHFSRRQTDFCSQLAPLVAQLVKNLPAMWGTCVWSLGWEDPLEKGTAIHSGILAWRIPWIV